MAEWDPIKFERRCPRCGVTKPLPEFARNRAKPDGRASYCRPCHADRARASIALRPKARRANVRASAAASRAPSSATRPPSRPSPPRTAPGSVADPLRCRCLELPLLGSRPLEPASR